MEALKAGGSVSEFWDMTPREVHALIEADNWRRDQAQRGRAWLAWHIAALQRVKRFPALARLMGPDKPKEVGPDELKKRRADFQEMKAVWERERH